MGTSRLMQNMYADAFELHPGLGCAVLSGHVHVVVYDVGCNRTVIQCLCLQNGLGVRPSP